MKKETINDTYAFGKNDLVIIGIPVYGGRVPSAAENRVKLIKGNNTPIILIVTYGNVHYQNAIFELQQLVTANGFITVGAAAIVSEHSAANEIASGRPDSQDLAAISSFTKQVYQRISQSNDCESITVKHDMNLRPMQRDTMPIKPHGDKKCTHCGTCVKLCPVHAIDDPRKKAERDCIRCMRCIKYCPQKARTYGKLMKNAARLFLTIVSHGEKQPEFFI